MFYNDFFLVSFTTISYKIFSGGFAMEQEAVVDIGRDETVVKPSTRRRRCKRLNEEKKSRYFDSRMKVGKPPFVLTGNLVQWTPPRSPYNLIQVGFILMSVY